jgi:spoIIIJ-associated protein
MIEIESLDLNSAIIEASKKLNCPYEDIDYHIIQTPKKGVFGIGRQNVIIVASCKNDEVKKIVKPTPPKKRIIKKVNIGSLLDKKDKLLKTISEKINYREQGDNVETQKFLDEVRDKVLNLFSVSSCLEIDICQVSLFDKETLLIQINGNDTELLIGNEGHRYKSLYFMLSSWIHISYGFKLNFEIGLFSKEDKIIIDEYLKKHVFPAIKKYGSFKTKAFKEPLIQIILQKLRAKYPVKYMKVRTTINDDKFIIIDNFVGQK